MEPMKTHISLLRSQLIWISTVSWFEIVRIEGLASSEYSSVYAANINDTDKSNNNNNNNNNNNQ